MRGVIVNDDVTKELLIVYNRCSKLGQTQCNSVRAGVLCEEEGRCVSSGYVWPRC